MASVLYRYLVLCLVMLLQVGVLVLATQFGTVVFLPDPKNHTTFSLFFGFPMAINIFLLQITIIMAFVVLSRGYSAPYLSTNIMAAPVDMLITMAGILLMVVNTMGDIATGILATYSHWKAQGYHRGFRFMVLLPGLMFALFVNAVMYIIFFIPMTILAKLWDHFFVEHDPETGDNTAGDIDGTDTISELDLNECGNDIGLNSEATQGIGDEE